MNYVFGASSELVQGSKDSPAYHGQATCRNGNFELAPDPLLRQSHFGSLTGFYQGSSLFRRDSGEIALVAEINVAGNKIIITTSLESRGNDEVRVSQLAEVLSDTACWNADRAIVVAVINLDASKIRTFRPQSANGIEDQRSAHASTLRA